eukprot:gene31661-6859_t
MARLDRAPALSNVCSVLLLLVAFFARTSAAAPDVVPKMSIERVVFQLAEGDIEFAFFHEVAPKTSAHIFELVSEGLYTSNDVFRVHKNFVAQVSAVTSRTLPFMSVAQRDLANQHVPLEVQEGVRHYEGAVSMGRNDNPNSGTSSFSMLLGAAHHLDMKYTLFGKVTKGMEVLHKLETLPTKTEGIFVMPLERIAILASYWYRAHGPLHLHMAGTEECKADLEDMNSRFSVLSGELEVAQKGQIILCDEQQQVHKKCLPNKTVATPSCAHGPLHLHVAGTEECKPDLEDMNSRSSVLSGELEVARKKCLPY